MVPYFQASTDLNEFISVLEDFCCNSKQTVQTPMEHIGLDERKRVFAVSDQVTNQSALIATRVHTGKFE